MVVAYGTVQPSNTGARAMMAAESGVIGRVYVRIGERVAAGAKLVQILPSPQSAAAYHQALSALKVARALVRSTRKLYSLHLATNEQLAAAETVIRQEQSVGMVVFVLLDILLSRVLYHLSIRERPY